MGFEERLARIGAGVPELGGELETLRRLAGIDHASALNKVRFIAEKALRSLCDGRGVAWGKGEPTLENMLGPLVAHEVIPRNVAIHLRTIQANASPGSHYQTSPLTASHLEIAQLALADFLEWFARESGAPVPAGDGGTAPAARPHASRARWAVPLALAAVAVGAAAAWLGPRLWTAAGERGEAAAPGSAAPRLLAPEDGATWSFTPIELRWEAAPGTGAAGWEVELLSGAATAARRLSLPQTVPYVLWPSAGGAAEPGRHRWRVRAAGDGAWSPWREFAFYRSMRDRMRTEGVLRIGMEITFHRPFVYLDGDGREPTGFDVELARRLAERLGVGLERVALPWDELFEAVARHRVDGVISAVSVTEERRARFGFSAPYLQTGQSLVALARGPAADPGLGEGLVLGVQRNTWAVGVAGARYPRARLAEYDTLDAAFAALARGDAGAVLCDDLVARFRPESADGSLRILQPLVTREPYAVLLPAGDDALRAEVDGALAALEADGTLAELRARYLGKAAGSAAPAR